MPSTGEGGNFLTPSTDPGGSLFSQRHLLILVFSWATALISLGCVSAGLYVICRVRKRMLASNMAWELLPILEKRKYFHPDIERGDIGAPKNEKFQILFLEGPPRPSTANLDDTEEEKQEHYEMANDSFSDVGDPDTSPIDPGSPIPMTSFDKTEAAVEPGDSIPFIFIGAPNDSPDPDYLPLPCSPTPYSTPPPTPPRSPIRRPLQMREASPFAPVSKPAWSIRASDAHPLGLASSTTISARSSPIPFSRSLPPTRPSSPFVSLRIPGQLDPEPPALVSTTSELSPESADRRAYRAPVPELDIAFAMQLRPGFGLGADPAWLVRFLMAMFGWMTVLIGGGGNARS